MARAKSIKLFLLSVALLVSTSAEPNALTDAALVSDTAFAFPIRHALVPLPDAVIKRVASQDDESPAVDEVDLWPPFEKPMDLNAFAGPVLTRRGMCSVIASVARTHDLPIPFFANLIWRESSFESKTISHAGAQGIAQFMPNTANEFGLINPFEPIHALNVAAKFLGNLYTRFGNFGLAAAAYNAGPHRVSNWIKKGGILPLETRRFVLRITGRPVDQWRFSEIKNDPEVALMPATAPCVEVTNAVEKLARVVRVARLIAELTQTTAPPAMCEIQDSLKSSQVDTLNNVDTLHNAIFGLAALNY